MSLVSTAPKVTSPTGWNRTPSKRRTPLEVVSQRYPSGDCWMSKTAPRPFSDVHLVWWKLAVRGIGPARAPLWDSSPMIRNAPATHRNLRDLMKVPLRAGSVSRRHPPHSPAPCASFEVKVCRQGQAPKSAPAPGKWSQADILLRGCRDGMAFPVRALVPFHNAASRTQRQDVWPTVAIHIGHCHLIALRYAGHIVDLPA